MGIQAEKSGAAVKWPLQLQLPEQTGLKQVSQLYGQQVPYFVHKSCRGCLKE